MPSSTDSRPAPSQELDASAVNGATMAQVWTYAITAAVARDRNSATALWTPTSSLTPGRVQASPVTDSQRTNFSPPRRPN